MPLVVVLAPEETGALTLAEWDAICARGRVLFERSDHPLRDRVAGRGIECEDLGAGPWPDLAEKDVVVVLDPSSTHVVEMARAGAGISIGAFDAPDELTKAFAAPVIRRAEHALGGLVAVMARLRSDEGCPWDREQSHQSLAVHMLEEAHEVLDAIEGGHLGTELEEELGDVLLQVVFHSRIAEQDDRFDIAEVAETLTTKLVNRHPHVFGDVSAADAAEVVRNWEAIKKTEGGRARSLEDLPRSLPALAAATKVLKQATGLGWSTAEPEASHRAAAALEAGAVGEALFWIVVLARTRGIDAEGALKQTLTNFTESLTRGPGDGQ